MKQYSLTEAELIDLIRFVIEKESIYKTWDNCYPLDIQSASYLYQFGIENFRSK